MLLSMWADAQPRDQRTEWWRSYARTATAHVVRNLAGVHLRLSIPHKSYPVEMFSVVACRLAGH
eukprot:6429449-Alexandrium_andersonii.AAC.1